MRSCSAPKSSWNAIGAYGAFVDYVRMLRAIEGAARSIATADFGRHLALRQASRSLEPLERRHGAPPPWRRRYGRRPLPKWGSGSNRRKTAGYTWAAAVRFVLRAAESDPVLATALTGAPSEDFLPPLTVRALRSSIRHRVHEHSGATSVAERPARDITLAVEATVWLALSHIERPAVGLSRPPMTSPTSSPGTWPTLPDHEITARDRDVAQEGPAARLGVTRSVTRQERRLLARQHLPTPE